MRVWREAWLRGPDADEATIAMFDLWRSLIQEKIGVPVEVVALDRREFPATRAFTGELHTAMPVTIEGKVVLALLLDVSTGPIEEVIITHELGHWVLKLQGFIAIRHVSSPNDNLEVLIASMAEHPALYALQRSIGHEPQTEINSRAKHNLALFSRDLEGKSPTKWLENAFMTADDLLNCSEDIYTPLRDVIEDNHPETARHLRVILETASHYNLLDARPYHRFMRRLIRNLRLGDAWDDLDNLASLQSMIRDLPSGY